MKLIYYLQGQDALSWQASLTYETSSPQAPGGIDMDEEQ